MPDAGLMVSCCVFGCWTAQGDLDFSSLESYRPFEPLVGLANSHPVASLEDLAHLHTQVLLEEDVLYSGSFCASECVVCQVCTAVGVQITRVASK